MIEDKGNSIFWSPPLVIRCRIYKYAFAGDDINVTISDYDSRAPTRKRAVERFLVNKLFYREALPVCAAHANCCFHMRRPKDIGTFVRRQQLAYRVLNKLGREPTLGPAAQPILLNLLTTMTIIWDRPDTQLPPDIGGWLPRLKHVCVQIRGCYVPAWTGTWTLRKLRERENVEPMVMLRALGLKALMGLEGLRSFEVVVLRSGEFKTLWVSGEWEVWRMNLEKLGTWVRLRVVEGDVFCKM